MWVKMSPVLAIAEKLSPKLSRLYIVYIVANLALVIVMLYLMRLGVWSVLTTETLPIDIVSLNREITVCFIICEGTVYLALKYCILKYDPEIVGAPGALSGIPSHNCKRLGILYVVMAYSLLLLFPILLLMCGRILFDVPATRTQKLRILVLSGALLLFVSPPVFHYLTSPSKNPKNIVISLISMFISAGTICYIVALSNVSIMLIDLMFLAIFGIFSLWKENIVDRTWLRLLARKNVVDINDILELSKVEKLSFQDLYVLVGYLKKFNIYNINILIEGILEFVAANGTLKKMKIDEINRLNYIPKAFKIHSFRVHLEVSNWAIPCSRFKALEEKVVKRALLLLICILISMGPVLYLFYINPAYRYKLILRLLETTLWIIVAVLIFAAVYIYLPKKEMFVKKVIAEELERRKQNG